MFASEEAPWAREAAGEVFHIKIEDGADRAGGPGDVLQAYMEAIRRTPLLTAQEERQLAQKVRQGDASARHRFLQCNLRLVVSIARCYLNRGVELADLIAEGNLGLMRALDKFDLDKGFRFTTYATWWIHQAVSRAVMNHGRLIRLPDAVGQDVIRYLAMMDRFEETGVRSEDSNTSRDGFFGKELQQVREWANLVTGIVSLDAPLGMDPSLSVADAVADPASLEVDEHIQVFQVKRHIHQCLRALPDRHRDVIERRYGLNGWEPESLEEIANRLCVTTQRIIQIQKEALEKMGRTFRKQGFAKEDLL